MFDDDFDPLTILQNHDDWIAEMATNVEALAKSEKDLARLVEQQHRLIRHLAIGFDHQHKLVMSLNERLERLEKQ
jgi:archaellum component FlaC